MAPSARLPLPGRRPLSATARRTWGRRARAALSLLAAAALLSACGGSGSSTSPAKLPPLRSEVGPVSILNPSGAAYDQPAATMAEMRQLGVVRVDMPVFWEYMSPNPAATAPPPGDRTSPAYYYPASGWWASLDTIDRIAHQEGIGLDIQITGPPPRWAEGRGAQHPERSTEWRPSTSEFEDFVRAVGTRYSGHYTPPGQSKPLPAVRFWSIWNEPNIGANLAPESTNHGQIEVAPSLYRGILDAAWRGLHATGHGGDQILIGELAPAGFRTGSLGIFNNMPPLQFLRALYCVDSNYHPLTGLAATQRDCPATSAASQQFAAQNPALFHASAFADHPYLFGLPPNQAAPNEPDYAELPEIGKLEHVLDTLNGAYGSSTHYDIYSTEFGYQTHPPDDEPGTVSPLTAAAWLNWSEYITWRDWPRLRSYDQYLLNDPATCNPNYQPQGHCDFATGIQTWNGIPKPGLYAFRMPIYLPATSTKAGHPLEVWGCVRPFYYVRHETTQPQIVKIQFTRGSGLKARWRTVGEAQLSNRYGYFDVLQRFPGSGQVRLAWSYPSGQQIFSRTVPISLH